MPAVSSVSPSGIPYVDYVDSGIKWASGDFTYSFPTSASFYTGFGGGAYGSGEQNNGFKAFNAIQQSATDVDPQHVFAGGQRHLHADHRVLDAERDLALCGIQYAQHGLGLLSVGRARRRRRLVQQFERLVQQPGSRQLRLADHHPRDRASARPQASARGVRLVRRGAGQRGLARIHGDELSLLHRGVDHAGAHQRHAGVFRRR